MEDRVNQNPSKFIMLGMAALKRSGLTKRAGAELFAHEPNILLGEDRLKLLLLCIQYHDCIMRSRTLLYVDIIHLSKCDQKRFSSKPVTLTVSDCASFLHPLSPPQRSRTRKSENTQSGLAGFDLDRKS